MTMALSMAKILSKKRPVVDNGVEPTLVHPFFSSKLDGFCLMESIAKQNLVVFFLCQKMLLLGSDREPIPKPGTMVDIF